MEKKYYSQPCVETSVLAKESLLLSSSNITNTEMSDITAD